MAAGDGKGGRGPVVVTGASTGIGEACALHLAAQGFRVFAGVRRPADGEALAAKGGGRIAPVTLDLTDAATIGAAAERVGAEVGEAGLAGLVNNAGIVVAGPLEFLPIDALRAQLEVNVVGQVAVTQAFLPLLRKARGRIVFMSSMAGRSADPFIGAYSASKFALEAVGDALRLELAPFGIRVALVEPGAIATPIWKKSATLAGENARRYPAAARALYGEALEAMRRFGEGAAKHGIAPEAVARAVAHALTSPHPRRRYLVGRDARIAVAIERLLPGRLRDAAIVRVMGLPRAARPGGPPR